MSRWLSYAVLAAVIAALSQLTPTNDAAWQLWIGQQLAHGAVLYRDIVEVNPPLWFWLAVPVVEISDAFGISGWAGLLGFFGLSAAVSIAFIQRLKPGLATSLILIFAFFVTGISATGQREQFTLIAVTPYVFLTAARAQRRPIPLWLAVAIGLWAALGLALKHYFALVPLALELWLLWRRPKALRPEFLVVCGAGVAYVAGVLLLMPDYLHSIVPIIHQSYAAYNKPLTELLTSDVVAISAIALLALKLVRPRSELVQALAVAGVAFLACYLIQLKGFRYHGLPAIGAFWIMALLAVMQLDWSSRRAKATALLLLAAPAIAAATTLRQSPKADEKRDQLCQVPRGSSVLVLTPYGDFAWPAVETCGLEWTSRYMFLWMLPSMDGSWDSSLARQVHAAVVEDIARYRPDFIFIQKQSPKGDALAFVMADPGFRSQLGHYRLIRSTIDVVEFQRIPPDREQAKG
ncbi:MAG TPA: hypothetical protein VFI88_07900 [Sphingomicrobium sp.]|nr:hypothetical protein [Sphingomicrobium sp.]